MTIQQRDYSIDIVKCLAAIIITNSHMELLYGDYAVLATGGAFGDALFFFCSGYTLFLGRTGSFFNWYKRRINRIYPTVFAWALLAVLCFNHAMSMDEILMSGGGWFVSCIMIYYVLLYPIKRYAVPYLKAVFMIVISVVLIWYYGFENHEHFSMYGHTYFKWCHFFLFMLLGAVMGLRYKEGKVPTVIKKMKFSIPLLLLSVVFFYAFFYFNRFSGWQNSVQLLSLIPLFFFCLSFYGVCNSQIAKRIYDNKVCKGILLTIGSLCLEIYLVQSSLFTDSMNAFFPFNLLIMFVYILLVAYVLRCMARIWSQTFKDGDYNWKEVIKLY